MSSQSTNSNIDRDVLREKERQARVRALNRGGRNNGPGAGGGSGRAGGGMEEMRESAPKPFFPQPIKVDPALEDETSRKIRNTLGDFREVQRYLEHDPKHLIGISSNPTLVNSSSVGNNGSQGQHQRSSSSKDSSSHHDDHNKKGMVNGQYKSPSFASGGNTGAMHHRNNRNHHPSQPPKHSQQSQNSSSGPSSVAGSSNYQAQSGRKSGVSNNSGKEAELPPTPSKGHRKKIPYPLSSSSSHGNRVINSSSGTSSTVNPASSSGVPKDAPTGGRSNKLNNSSSSRPDSRRSNPSDHGSASGLVKSGAGLGFNSSSRGASSNSSYHNSHNGENSSNTAQNNTDNGRLPRIPKLPLAAMSSDNALPLDATSGSVVELETILQEMKQGVPPPLSAIETPRVEDSRIFFSPDPISDDPVHNTSQSSNTQNHGKSWTSRGRSSNGGRRQEKPPTLREDLAISESDDEGDFPQKKMSRRLSDYRSPSASYGFQYGGVSDNHSSHNQTSQHYPLSRHVGGVPGTPPGTPPESPPSSPHGSSPGSINGSPIHSLQGSVIHSPPGSLPGSPQHSIRGSPIHSPMDLDPPSPRSPSVVSNRGSTDSSNNSSSVSSEGETSDEESEKEEVEDDRKDSDDANDDPKGREIKVKEFEANTVNEREGNVDDGAVHSGDDSVGKNNWALKNFMEKKNSPALPVLATPGRSGLGYRSDRLGSDNTVASSCDGKGDRSDTHLGQGERYDSLVSEILNPTPDIKEILRSPTPYIMELDNMRPNQNASSSQGDLSSPINSPETPALRRQENLRVQSSSSDSKRHSSTYYNPAMRSSVSPCAKRNNGREDEPCQPSIRARTANKTSKHKSRKDTHKSRQNNSDLSDSDYEDKKSVSPKRSSSVSSSCSSIDGRSEAPPKKPATVTVTTSRKNDSSADSRKPRPITGKKGVKKMGKGANANKVARVGVKIVKKRTSSTSAGRSISPHENPTSKMPPKPKIVKREKVKEKPPPVVKEAPRKTPKMPGRPPGSGKVASKTVATTKKNSGDESDKNKKGKTPVFKSREYIESSESDSSANSASEEESAASNAEEEDEAGEVGEVVFGKSPRKKPFAMVHPLPPLSPVKPLPVKAVIAPITKPEITLPPKDFSVPLKSLTPGRPPGKSKSSKERIPVQELLEDHDRSEALSTPNSNRIEYNEETLPPRLMVRISLSLLDRIPKYPPVSRSIARVSVEDCTDYEKIIPEDTGSRLSSKGRDVSQERFGLKESADSATKRDSSRETAVRAKEAKAQASVKKRNSSMEAASRPSKCRTPPPATKRKLKEEDKKEVPYAKRQKNKAEKIDTSQSERSNLVADEEMKYDNVIPKMERSDSVSSLASFTSQQSHHGSLRSATPTGMKRSSKKEKKEKDIKKETPVEQLPKSNISVARAGAITPSESKKVSGSVKKEPTSNVASVVSEKEARKKEKEEKRKHRNRSKEKPDPNASSISGGSSGTGGKSGESASQATQQSSKDSGESDSKSKVKRMKMSPKRDIQDEESSSQRSSNSKGGKESSKGEKKSCDKGGPIDNSASAAQCRLDYEPRDERPSSDYYLGEAKRLKHQADKEANRTLQVTKYLEAILYFILTGTAMEDAQHDKDKVYTMYKETLHLIKYAWSISSKFQKNQSSSAGSTDNKLAVLSLRCQSRLFLKLFAIRKPEVKDLQRKITEFQKSQAGKLATQLSLTAGNAIPNQLLNSGHHLKSPCQPGRSLSGNGANGVPSPHSPTPSPAGSVGSQSSGYSSSEINGNQGRHSLPNSGSSGHPHAPGSIALPGNLSHQSTSGSSVSVPAIIYGMMQRQQSHYSNLQQCHDLWEQGDYLIACCHVKDFFDSLDKTCGKLTLHSTISELVHYIHQGLNRLKDSDT